MKRRGWAVLIAIVVAMVYQFAGIEPGLAQPRTALIIVDMQNDFATKGGALYVPSTEGIKPKLQMLVDEARKQGIPVVFTQDWHLKNDPEFQIWPPHTVQGTKGAEIIPELPVLEGDYTIKKRTYNAFFETDLDLLLRHLGVKRLVVTGVVSNVCVLNTAGDGALRGYEIVIPADALAPLSDFDQQATLRQVSFLYKGIITTADKAFDPNPTPLKVETTAKAPEVKVEPAVKLPRGSAAVIVVDMQNDFAKDGGKLYVPKTKETIAPIKQLLAKARGAGVPVIFTQDWHRPDDPEFKIWPPHTIEGSEGAQVLAEFAPSPKDYYVKKRTYDAFYGTDLDLLLRQMGIRNVVIVGTVSNICVLHTAGKARLHGYNVVVARDGISSLTEFDQQLSLRQISWLYSGKITTVDGITFE